MWPSYFLLFVNIIVISTVGCSGKNYCSSSNCKNNKQLCKFQQSQNPARHCLDLEELIKTDNDKTLILNKINSRRNKVASGDLRSFPSSANMLKLGWNTTLQMSAQRWVDQCVAGSTPDISDACRDLGDLNMMLINLVNLGVFKSRVNRYILEGLEVGQNIATVYGESPGLQPTALVDVWYMELLNVNGSILPRFNESSADGPHYDYFSQLVWADTKEVGCGAAKFKERFDKQNGDRNRTVYRLVCNFFPAGNRVNQSVYSLGPSCSKCPDGTECDKNYKNLCSTTMPAEAAIKLQHYLQYFTLYMYKPWRTCLISTRKIQEDNTTISNKTNNLMNNTLKTNKDEIPSPANFTATEAEEISGPFDYFSYINEFTRHTITVTTTPKPECKDVLAVDDFIDLIRKRLSNDHIFRELIFATKTTQINTDINFTDPNVAAFIKRIYSKKVPLTTFRSTENEILNSTLLVDLVEAIIFRSGDKIPTLKSIEQSTLPMSDISPIKIQAELAQVQTNEEFSGHYFFPEVEEEGGSISETTESYYDLPSLSVADVIMEIEDIKKSTVTKNFLDDILESESLTELSSTAAVVMSPDDMTAHKSGHEIMKKFLEDIKDKAGRQ